MKKITNLFFSTPLLKSAILLASTIMLNSCQEPETAKPVQPAAVKQNFDDASFRKSANVDLEDVAAMVARSLKDVEVRKALHAEASKQFDGDYDILYKNFSTFAFSNGEKFEDKLAKAGAARSGRTSAETAVRLKSILGTFPILNIAVPVNIEKWDAASFTPLVAFRPVDYDEATATTVKAYDADGNVHFLDAQNDPTVPVIVVGLSERVDNEGQLLPGMKLVSNDDAINKLKGARKQDVLGPYRRDYVNYDNYLETLESAGFNSMSKLRVFEDWVSGRVELRLDIMHLNKTISDSHPFSGTQKEFERPRYLGVGIFYWSYFVMGDRVGYHWTETDDAGQSIEFKLGISGKIGPLSVTSEVKIGIDGNDDKIGHREVQFVHGIPGTYDIGDAFKFTTVQY
jgi:hypothetical protein